MPEITRDLLANVAMANPRLAGSVATLVDEMRHGELPDPELLVVFGQHVREIGELIIGRAEVLEAQRAIDA